MSTPLTFTISEGFEDDSDAPVQYGTYSRDWEDEKGLDTLWTAWTEVPSAPSKQSCTLKSFSHNIQKTSNSKTT